MDDVELISREELTTYLFTVQDIKRDLRRIRRLLEDEDDGETTEDDA